MKIKAKQPNHKGKIPKRTRGYRLKPATHMLIVKIQKLLKSDQDEAIACACNMFYEVLRKKTLITKKNFY